GDHRVILPIAARRGKSTVGISCDHDRVDSTANEEVADHFAPPRLQRADQVVEDPVGDRLVEGAFVPVAPEVELEALQLHAGAIRHVRDLDGGKVRLAGHGADAGELRALEPDFVIASRTWSRAWREATSML